MGCLGWALILLGALVALVTLFLAPLIYVPLLIVGVALVVTGGRRRQERHLERLMEETRGARMRDCEAYDRRGPGFMQDEEADDGPPR